MKKPIHTNREHLIILLAFIAMSFGLCNTALGVSWNGTQTSGSYTNDTESLLEQPNMDAELFVRIGLPLQPLFMQRVHEMIFGQQPVETIN